MNRYSIVLIIICFLALPAIHSQDKPDTTPETTETNGLSIVVTSLKADDKILQIDYEVINNSRQEIWICDSISHSCNFEIFMEDDNQTIIVRRRLDVPSAMDWLIQPHGRYICLDSGKKRRESLLLSLPIYSRRFYSNESHEKDVQFAPHLAIEIGYYVGNLPKMVFNMLKEIGTSADDRIGIFYFNGWFGDELSFSKRHEDIRQRDEEVLIPYTRQSFKGEKVLRSEVAKIKIPYKETIKRIKQDTPELSSVNRIEIRYEPSMLEYFFPFQGQIDLLSKEEIKHLRSEKTIIFEDPTDISRFSNELKEVKQISGGIVSEESKAKVFCYQDGNLITSFVVYDNTSIETEQKQRIRYVRRLQSLTMQTPQIQPFELRMQCASNLSNLWHRLRLYDIAVKKRKSIEESIQSNMKSFDSDRSKYQKNDKNGKTDFIMENLRKEMNLHIESLKKRYKDLYSNSKLVYPDPTNWCDALGFAYSKSEMKILICPSASEGKCYYAMNPNCGPNSPGDMVLLFETKAGWNEHGGPELFTLDNHDPRGGCVLLNDGTVKFIRTEEELNALRWK